MQKPITVVATLAVLAVSSSAGAYTTTDIANLAHANISKKACSTNSLGGKDFFTSCTGNGGYPEYWCADFAHWVWANNGVSYASELDAAAGSFYVYGENHGTLHSKPAIGDAVVFDWHGDGTADHVAIVTQVNSDGTIETASGDWGGVNGTEAEFASTSSVVLNTPAYSSSEGSTPGVMGMTISGYISPVGVSALAELAASFVSQGSSAPADPSKAAFYKVCSGDKFTFYFELKNTGAASWTDVDDTSAGQWGKAVRLQTSDNKPDPLAGVTQISINENTNHDVATGSTTQFTTKGIAGTAPSQPGIYKTSWSLVDDGRGTFGPAMYLTFDVVDCGSDAGPTEDDGGTTTSDGGVKPPPSGDGGTGDDPGTGGCSAQPGPARGTLSAGLMMLGLLLTRRSKRRA